MRQKITIALSLVILFSIVFGAQLATTASAHMKNGNPLTSPLTFFQMSGNITYKCIKLFHHGAQRLDAAVGVTVTAENIFTHEKYTTTTDSNGNYSLNVEEKGVFLVGPSGGSTSTWVPPLRSVHVTKSGMKNDLNFQGLTLQ